MIELDPSQKAPLYEQLYAALADEIRTGQRAAGTPLPGRRTMAAQQGVSVNTVDTAYQMLAAEGLAEARPRSGFYVQSTYGMLHSRARRTPAAPVPPPAAPAGPVPLYDLSTGSVDTALFPAHSWGRIQKELLYQRPELLQRGEMQGDAPLRAQIAEYLSVYRGVDCTPEQSSSAQVLSTCWAAWRTCSMMGWRPSKTPDTPARGRSCRTAASTARLWTSTVRAYPPPRWKRAARTSAT